MRELIQREAEIIGEGADESLSGGGLLVDGRDDGVECIEEKMEVDLGTENIEFGFHVGLFLMGLIDLAADRVSPFFEPQIKSAPTQEGEEPEEGAGSQVERAKHGAGGRVET